MALKPVTDPKVLQQLGARKPVTDPGLLAQLNEASPVAPQNSEGFLSSIGRGAGLVGRAGVQGIATLPLMAMDAGVAARNIGGRIADKTGVAEKIYALNRKLAGNSEILASILPAGPGEAEAPSKLFNEALTQAGAPVPKGPVENIGSLAISMATSGKVLPAPTVKNPAPPNFTKAAQNPVKMATLKAAQREGYVVPPSTTNPTATNRALEGAAGKLTTAQLASAKNQAVTNKLAARSVGLKADAPLTKEAFSGVRKTAGKVYKEIADSGNVKVDQQFLDDIANLPSAVKTEIAPTKNDFITWSKMTTEEAPVSARGLVQKLKELRFESQRNLSPLAAQNPQSAALGNAQKKAAESVESLIMRHLNASNKADLADKFTAARQLIAKTHSVEKAFNESTGNVNAMKLAAQLSKGKPLTADLKTIANFGQAFPKAAREFNESLPGISPLDYYASGGVTAMSQQPWWLLYPFARQGIRSGLLSKAGQHLATPSISAPMPAAVYGSAPLANALLQQ